MEKESNCQAFIPEGTLLFSFSIFHRARPASTRPPTFSAVTSQSVMKALWKKIAPSPLVMVTSNQLTFKASPPSVSGTWLAQRYV